MWLFSKFIMSLKRQVNLKQNKNLEKICFGMEVYVVLYASIVICLILSSIVSNFVKK